MTVSYLAITAHDPIVSRDGRPFGMKDKERRMRLLEWIYPSVLAGSIRTMLGKRMDGNFDPETVKALKQLSISGPFPWTNGQLYVPAPKDILVRNETGNRSCIAIRPQKMEKECGCDLPEGLLPAMHNSNEEFKPEKVPAFWSMAKMIAWLANPDGDNFESPPSTEDLNEVSDFMNWPEKDVRIHVRIDPNTGTSEDGGLFVTAGLDLTLNGLMKGEPLQIAARIESNGFSDDLIGDLDSLHPMGGERRLAHWKSEDMDASWAYPPEMEGCFKGPAGKRLRMILATPAIFTNGTDGWLPGWLESTEDGITGRPPGGPKDVTLKLVSACVERWKPISGWSMEDWKRGQKPIRRLAPAGSVYFFEVQSEDAEELARSLWLKPVSDDEQDRWDGFGLALWGVWDAPEE